MTSSQLSAVFLLALFAGLMIPFWLAMRQMLHVRHHRGTVPAAFSASETFDVGVDLGSPVSREYFGRRPFAFDGTIHKVTVSLK